MRSQGLWGAPSRTRAAAGAGQQEGGGACEPQGHPPGRPGAGSRRRPAQRTSPRRQRPQGFSGNESAGAGCSRPRRPPDRRRERPRTHTLGFKAERPTLPGAGRALPPREPLPRLPETARARRWGVGPGGACAAAGGRGGAGRSAAAGSQGLPLPQFATVRLCFASRGTGLPPAYSNSRFQTVSGESLELCQPPSGKHPSLRLTFGKRLLS